MRCMGCLRHGTTNRIWPKIKTGKIVVLFNMVHVLSCVFFCLCFFLLSLYYTLQSTVYSLHLIVPRQCFPYNVIASSKQFVLQCELKSNIIFRMTKWHTSGQVARSSHAVRLTVYNVWSQYHKMPSEMG